MSQHEPGLVNVAFVVELFCVNVTFNIFLRLLKYYRVGFYYSRNHIGYIVFFEVRITWFSSLDR